MVPTKKKVSMTSVMGIPGVVALVLAVLLNKLDLGFDTEIIQIVSGAISGVLLSAWAKFTADDKKEVIIESTNKASSDNGQ